MGRTRINKLQHIQKSNQVFEQITRMSVQKPEKGKMVIFPAYFTHMHRGNKPISKDDSLRFSLNISFP